MDLLIWLVSKRMNISQFAEKIGYAPNHIYAIKNGRHKPGKKFVKAVEAFTEGWVTKKDLDTIYFANSAENIARRNFEDFFKNNE